MVETVLVLIQVVSLVRLPGLALRIECPKTREAVVCKTEGKEKGGGGGGVLVHPFHLIIDLVVAFLAFPFFFFWLTPLLPLTEQWRGTARLQGLYRYMYFQERVHGRVYILSRRPLASMVMGILIDLI